MLGFVFERGEKSVVGKGFCFSAFSTFHSNDCQVSLRIVYPFPNDKF